MNGMRPIGATRLAIEGEGHRHLVKRGWLRSLHIENVPSLFTLLGYFLKLTLLDVPGRKNALDVQLETIDIHLPGLPKGFDGVKLLFVSDLHIDGQEGLAEKLIGLIEPLTYDFCLLGGDYTFGADRESEVATSRMVKIATYLAGRTEVFGILGNHDRYAMGECLNQCGVKMLINSNVCLEHAGDSLYLVGLDDSHYYHADDLELAEEGLPPDAFRVMLAHSPERYESVANAGYALSLSGHTHGGQICLPNGFALATCATVPRSMVRGTWQYGDMKGYTSRGCGTSGLPFRFFCPPEITLITLRGDAEGGLHS
jgi:predicted MPP superfamily phosphohydrolase